MIDFRNYLAPANLLKDKVILVTGAGDGIGKAAALSFAQHGATVILLGRTVSKLEITYDLIEQAGYPQAAIYPLNLLHANSENCAELAQNIQNEFGKLNGVLHNAGILGHQTSIEKYDPDTWQQVLQINATAPFLLTQALLPLLEIEPQGSIIFTSSGVAQQGRAYWGAYSVSKAASDNLMQILASELENTTTIRVNSLNPGGTRTQMRATAYPGENPSTNPAPNEIMAHYLYLMGSDSIGVNGQILQVQAPKK